MCEFLSRMGFPVSAVVEPAEVPSNQLSTSTLRPVEVKEEEEHCEDDLFWGLWDTDALLSAVAWRTLALFPPQHPPTVLARFCSITISQGIGEVPV